MGVDGSATKKASSACLAALLLHAHVMRKMNEQIVKCIAKSLGGRRRRARVRAQSSQVFVTPAREFDTGKCNVTSQQANTKRIVICFACMLICIVYTLRLENLEQ